MIKNVHLSTWYVVSIMCVWWCQYVNVNDLHVWVWTAPKATWSDLCWFKVVSLPNIAMQLRIMWEKLQHLYVTLKMFRFTTAEYVGWFVFGWASLSKLELNLNDNLMCVADLLQSHKRDFPRWGAATFHEGWRVFMRRHGSWYSRSAPHNTHGQSQIVNSRWTHEFHLNAQHANFPSRPQRRGSTAVRTVTSTLSLATSCWTTRSSRVGCPPPPSLTQVWLFFYSCYFHAIVKSVYEGVTRRL